VCYSQWKREKWFNKVATVISFSYISDISSSCLHVLPLLVNLYQMSLYRYTLCPRKKTCDCILYNNFNSKCPITIIFGIVSSQSMRRRRHVKFWSVNKTTLSYIAPTTPSSCCSGRDTGLHRSWPLAAKQFRSEPVDYKIWGVVQQHAYTYRISNVDELKQSLVEIWGDLQQSVIDSAVSQWRQRLSACVDRDILSTCYEPVWQILGSKELMTLCK